MYPIFISNQSIISNVAMTANITSGKQDVSEAIIYSVQSSWSGTTPVGSLVVEASNDGVNWDAVDTLAIASNSGTHVYNSPLIGYIWVQVNYTFTSGIGSLTSILAKKGF